MTTAPPRRGLEGRAAAPCCVSRVTGALPGALGILVGVVSSPELLPVSCALAEAPPSRGQTGHLGLGAAAAPRPQRLRAGRRAKPPRVGFLRSRDRVPFPERV